MKIQLIDLVSTSAELEDYSELSESAGPRVHPSLNALEGIQVELRNILRTVTNVGFFPNAQTVKQFAAVHKILGKINGMTPKEKHRSFLEEMKKISSDMGGIKYAANTPERKAAVALWRALCEHTREPYSWSGGGSFRTVQNGKRMTYGLYDRVYMNKLWKCAKLAIPLYAGNLAVAKRNIDKYSYKWPGEAVEFFGRDWLKKNLHSPFMVE